MSNQESNITPETTGKTAQLVVGVDLTDESFDALDRALAFAGLIPNTTVHIAATPDGGIGPLAMVPPAERQDALQHYVSSFLARQAAAGIEYPNVDVSLHVLLGEPADALSQLAFMVEGDVLVVAAKEQKGIEDALFGSVERKLVKEAPCPVLVVRPRVTEAIPEVEERPRAAQDTHSSRPQPPTRQAGVPRNVSAEENLPLTYHSGQ